jgi:hypothetical protein
MKNILFVCLLVGTLSANSQFLTQSAEGKSAIPLPLRGAGISVDIGKTEVAFGVNNYSKVFDSVTNQWFWGANLTGKNKKGFANLFNAGDIVPEGDLLLFTGYSISNTQWISNNYHNSKLYDSIKEAKQEIVTINASLYSLTKKSFNTHKPKIKDQKIADSIISQLEDTLEDNPDIRPVLEWYKKSDKELEAFISAVSADVEKIRAGIVRKTHAIRVENKKRRIKADSIFFKDHHPWRLTLFLQGGIRAREFKRYLGITTPDFGKSFQDTIFRGGHFGIGANFHIGNLWIGATYSYLKTDNFSTLSGKEYTLRRTDTLTQVLIQEKKVTAYPGKYSRVETNELNIDFVYDFKINDTSRIMVNPYLRASLFSRDTSYLKNFTNVGLGVYFLGKKRKFIGGLYVELPDISNNAEKAKPEAEMNIRPPFQKLHFGIVTKFNLSSIFNFENRRAAVD